MKRESARIPSLRKAKGEINMKYPVKLKPVTKQIIWGGTRLSTEYGIGTPGEKTAEAWELTCRPDGVNEIENGEYAGRLFSDYIKENPEYVSEGFAGDRFPLLIKLIDAEADLSIQVHPDNEYAAAHTDDLGKTEMWYIVSAAPDAKIIYGLKKKYTSDEIRAAIAAGTLEKLMNYIPVKAGEAYFIPSGLVHAICHGILIAEIQQNSNITYRVYDYNRRQPDGSLRALHVDDALAVIERFDENAVKSVHEGDIIAKCRYFTVRHITVSGKEALFADKNSFVNLLCTDGNAEILCCNSVYPISKGESYFIPAGMGNFEISGNAEAIVTTL